MAGIAVGAVIAVVAAVAVIALVVIAYKKKQAALGGGEGRVRMAEQKVNSVVELIDEDIDIDDEEDDEEEAEDPQCGEVYAQGGLFGQFPIMDDEPERAPRYDDAMGMIDIDMDMDIDVDDMF